MRISDWSSDVCSSDLIGKSWTGLRNNNLGTPTAAPSGRRLSRLTLASEGAESSIMFPICFYRLIPSGRRLNILYCLGNFSFARYPDTRRAKSAQSYPEVSTDLSASDVLRSSRAIRASPAARICWDSRSEEHTSELQSLMR